mgnify:FL=1
MAIAYENATTKNIDWGPTTGNVSFNSGTNSDRCVLVFAWIDRGGADTITGATYGGNTMTAGTAMQSGITGYDGRLFWIAGASCPSGANNINVTVSSGGCKVGFVAVAYSGVDGTTPVSNETTGGTNSSTNTWTLSSATGNLVVALASMNPAGITVSGGSGTTMRVNATGLTTFTANAFEKAGASSVTISGTTSGSTEWWGTAVSLNAVGGGGGGSTNKTLMMFGLG